MFDALFGADVPLAVKFFLAFVIVLALIGGTAWVVRRLGSRRLGSANGRGRQPRLAVIDSANVDGRRRLLMIRRDNVEHPEGTPETHDEYIYVTDFGFFELSPVEGPPS